MCHISNATLRALCAFSCSPAHTPFKKQPTVVWLTPSSQTLPVTFPWSPTISVHQRHRTCVVLQATHPAGQPPLKSYPSLNFLPRQGTYFAIPSTVQVYNLFLAPPSIRDPKYRGIYWLVFDFPSVHILSSV